MLLRRFTDFVLQNRLQTIAMVFILAFIPIIGSISILIAALITLRKGAFEGAILLIAATLPAVISYFISTPDPLYVQLAMGALGMIIASNLLTWLFAVVLSRFNNWSFTLELAVLLAVLVIGIVHLIFPDIQNWWATQLNAYFAKAAADVSEMIEAKTQAVPNEIQVHTIAVMKKYATGFIAVSILFNALLQLLIARWWQAVIFNPGGLRKELYQIRLGRIASLVFVVGLVLAYLGNEFALDILPVLYATFFVAGLSLLHNLVSITKTGWLWLILIYALIIWLFPVSLIIIATIALLDTGLNFRKRFLL